MGVMAQDCQEDLNGFENPIEIDLDEEEPPDCPITRTRVSSVTTPTIIVGDLENGGSVTTPSIIVGDLENAGSIQRDTGTASSKPVEESDEDDLENAGSIQRERDAGTPSSKPVEESDEDVGDLENAGSIQRERDAGTPSSKPMEESDEDVAVIRIREIGSLRDDDSDDDGIQVVSILPEDIPEISPAIRTIKHIEVEHTPYVMMDKNSDDDIFVAINMLCELDNTNTTKEGRRKSLLLRKKLVELSHMLKEFQQQGEPGINVRRKEKLNEVTTVSTVATTIASTGVTASSLVRPPLRAQGPATPVQTSATTLARPTGTFVRLNYNPNTINCVVTSRGIEQTSSINAAPIRTFTTMNRATRPGILNPGVSSQHMNTSGNMHSVVFDPTSGLLLCPTTQSSPATSVTASQQVANANMRQTFRAIQASPQFLAQFRSGALPMGRPLMVNGTPITRVFQPNSNIGSTGLSTSNIVPNMTSNIVRTNTPIQLTATQGLRQRLPVTLVTPTSTNSQIASPRLRTYQSIAPKNQGPTQTHFSNGNGQLATNIVRQPAALGNTNSSIRNPTVSQFTPTSQPSKTRPTYQAPATAAPASASFIRRSAESGKKSELTAGSQEVQSLDNGNEKATAKTFPSLVVVVKPYLQEKLTKPQSSTVRSELDAKVKTILMQSPVKFTEWLIQKGLLKMDHKCYIHRLPYKLGMYSDSDKYPYSGGYVLTVDCCPERQLPVFQGSIFEASMYPPGTTMKLVYHWACQTPAPSVLQWVKVNSYYLKNFYTLLRSVCVAALHESASTMGGKGKYIEVGVVTLGTMPGMQQGVSKPMKIEILGIFDPGAKLIRMKLLNVTAGLTGELAKRERIDQILTPLSNWVNRDSALLIDSSLDKTMVEKLGFRNVSQSKTPTGVPVKTSIPTNVNVMNYLRNIVPKMFQNTLCVLSKSLIQQFLDELSWRELWGPQPLKAFDTVLVHLASMTKIDTGDLLIPRLNKISLNPFADWSYSEKTLPPPSGIECLPDSIRSQPLSELVASAAGMDSSISSLVTTYMENASGSRQSKSSMSRTTVAKSMNVDTKTKGTRSGSKRKADEDVSSIDLQKTILQTQRTHTLQAYYYIYCPSSMEKYKVEFPTNLKCPLCSKVLRGSTDTISHLINHVLSAGRLTPNPQGCRYCLKEVGTPALLEQHINYAHKKLGETNVCRICSDKYPSETLLILHMWKRHLNCEAPYRCEVCDYRTSFHYDVIDHFYKEHGTSDTVQCPVCLKTFACRSIPCLKNVVTHLQNHVLRKGKKCQDCYLVFATDLDHRAHLLTDQAHESRCKKNFVQHEVDDTPIRMPKPPFVNKELNIPPPKKTKARRISGPAQTNYQTLNSSFAVPLNPSDRYMFTAMNIKISDVEMFAGMSCWECFKPINLVGHYRGTMKCSRCRFETCCSFTIQKHVKTHDTTTVNQPIVATKLNLARESDLNSDILECSGCHFSTGSTIRLARHLLNTGHKTCSPKISVDPAISANSN